ncbi:MAG: hypothetical protein AUH39_01835 [Chloroflexi bacterium 13_1_40CM_67_9]|nr:MAG: hypothetical protein AUH39_01835 [Chloroflexi bacterium 13_1_40CM_67_9]
MEVPTGERNEDAVDREVLLDVDRGGDRDDRLPDELVAAPDPEAVPDVHEVVDSAEGADADERADRHDGLRDVVVAKGFRQQQQDKRPKERDHADEKAATHRWDALLCEVAARPLAADVLADSEVSEKLNVGTTQHQADEERRDHHPKREDGEPLRRHHAFAAG